MQKAFLSQLDICSLYLIISTEPITNKTYLYLKLTNNDGIESSTRRPHCFQPWLRWLKFIIKHSSSQFTRVMALKIGSLLKNTNLSKSCKRLTSQYHPIDEYIFGLTYEQIQVRSNQFINVLIDNVNHCVVLILDSGLV